MKDWRNFLHRILEEDSEDSAPIKMFLLVGGSTASNDGSWRPPVVVGGGEGGVRVWVAFGEEERVKIMFFTLKNVFIICRSCLASSSR